MCQVRHTAEEKLAFAHQLSGSMHVETCAGGLESPNLRIFQEQEIKGRCAVSAFPPRIPFVTPVLPGPGSDIRMMMGWKVMSKTEKSGVWFFQNVGGLLGRLKIPMLIGAVDWVWKGSYHTAWAVPSGSSCSCLYAYGRGSAIGPHTGGRVWRTIAPLLKPWCAEGEVPTAANLNLYRGGNSCVRWHCDGEPLFGVVGDSKLIVSVGFGSHAPFKWKGKSCTDGEASACCLGHGDILVMDGQCQDEFLHCTDPGLERERINVRFRWVEQHAASCPLRALQVFPLMSAGFGLRRCADRWTRPVGGEVGGGIICVTLGEFTGLHKKVPQVIVGVEVLPFSMLYVPASAGLPSLLGYYACMELWVKGAFRRNCRQILCKTSFSRLRVFLFSRNSSFWWGRSASLAPVDW